MGQSRSRLIAVLSLLLGGGLAVSVCLPWYRVPVMGWSIPTPAWNSAGLACICLSLTLFLRAIAGLKLRWLVRIAQFPAFYFWWTSLASIRTWGTKNLGAIQLKLSTVNQALARLGSETINVYEAPLWKSIEPELGWYLAGGFMVVSLILTVIDGPHRQKCSSCGLSLVVGDRFCHGCGNGLLEVQGCSRCGSELSKGDKFCRHCGCEA